MATTTQRHHRIERRASPPVLEAYREGRITARRADILLHLPAAEQAAELERRLAKAHEREQIHATVARTIREYLDTTSKVDLQELNERIRSAMT